MTEHAAAAPPPAPRSFNAVAAGGWTLAQKGVLVICVLLVLGYLLVRVYAAADPQPHFAQQPHHPHAVAAHRHKLA